MLKWKARSPLVVVPALVAVLALVAGGAWGAISHRQGVERARVAQSASASAAADAAQEASRERLAALVEETGKWRSQVGGELDTSVLADAAGAAKDALEGGADKRGLDEAYSRLKIAYGDSQSARMRQAEAEREEAEARASQSAAAQVRRLEAERAAEQARREAAEREAEREAEQARRQAEASQKAEQGEKAQTPTWEAQPQPGPADVPQTLEQAVTRTVECTAEATITVTGTGALAVNGTPIESGASATGTRFTATARAPSPQIHVAWTSDTGTCTVR